MVEFYVVQIPQILALKMKYLKVQELTGVNSVKIRFMDENGQQTIKHSWLFHWEQMFTLYTGRLWNNSLACLSISFYNVPHLSSKASSCDSSVNGIERETPNRNSHHAPSPGRVTLKGDLLHTWIVSVVPPHSPTRHGTPTSIWHLSSIRFPWEAKGLSVCYFQTRKSCWCACVRRSCSLKLSQ